MRVAIAGAGAVGRSIARELIQNGHQVLLIDKNSDSIKPERVPDAEWLLADSCELSSLEEAREEARSWFFSMLRAEPSGDHVDERSAEYAAVMDSDRVDAYAADGDRLGDRDGAEAAGVEYRDLATFRGLRDRARERLAWRRAAARVDVVTDPRHPGARRLGGRNGAPDERADGKGHGTADHTTLHNSPCTEQRTLLELAVGSCEFQGGATCVPRGSVC